MVDRLQKILSQYGVASRRQAEQLIAAGQVQVNGEIAHLGQRADPQRDRIEVNHQLIQAHHRPTQHYLLLHKPLGMVSTCADPEGRQTVFSALPADLHHVGIHPVGRLDAYSTGALLLTNDGDFTFRLTHPRHDVPKTYWLRLEGNVSSAALAAWRQGIQLDQQLTRPAQVRVLASGPTDTQIEVILQEGRNRQIRRVAQILGYRVLDLHRVAVGSVGLSNLRAGAYRALSTDEIKALLDQSSVSSTPSAGLSRSSASHSPS
ncbi:rRNA pseudouridine synthase [Nodosilinea sp. LEGE 07088]|uniref:pseudouridine synthase n=1 Tax=Nodosilinea sp. LEGE 07088 TaxID=2777968 RepID=UPI001882C688|nr:pseudouridine synthase [Nodosilinea sp. LEGE 07088]MBE9136909.1 rRNA pseudouridine synthase [Nodosilinea sp. LEGE 07088]